MSLRFHRRGCRFCLWLLAVAVILALGGCSGTPGSPLASPAPPSSPPPTPPPPPPPAISSTSPQSGATCVSLIAPVVVIFNPADTPANVTTANFTLSGPFGPVPGLVSYNGSTATATFTAGDQADEPPFPLGELSLYTATVSGLPSGSFSFSFKTGPCGPPPIYPGTATLFDAPNARLTWIFGVNNLGAIAGFYADQSGNGHGFISQNGQLTNLKDQAFKVNDIGAVVGIDSKNGQTTGYLYQNGQYTAIIFNNSLQSWAYGINNAGEIVGRYNANSNSVSAGFLRHADGSYSPFPAPDSQSAANGTFPTDINDHGDVVGQGFNLSPFASYLFSNGAFTSIRVPQAANGATVQAWGLNNHDDVAGLWVSSQNVAGFVRFAGTYYEVAVPGCYNVQAEGINDLGVVVGICSTQQGDQFQDHGFILKPK